jgi:uncharacterized protein YjbI with pentapeptide repeats
MMNGHRVGTFVLSAAITVIVILSPSLYLASTGSSLDSVGSGPAYLPMATPASALSAATSHSAGSSNPLTPRTHTPVSSPASEPAVPTLSGGSSASPAPHVDAGSGGGPSGGASGSDYSVFAPAGTYIGAASGSFPSTYDLTSEYNTGSGGNCSPGTSNCYSLQLNSNLFSFIATPSTGTAVYNDSWQQFVYENQPEGGSNIYIQYVLIGSHPSGAGCSGVVSLDGISWSVNPKQPSICYGFSPSVSVGSSFVSAPLSDLVLNAQANYEGSGNDVLQLCGTPSSGLGCTSPLTMPDNILDLYQNWTGSEFNVFGDAGGSEAVYNVGTTITVSNTITQPNGDSIAPTCERYSQTGETNNLLLGPCGTISSGIQFTEASLSYTVTVSPSDITVLRGQPATYTITVSLTGGTTEPVTLSILGGLPFPAVVNFALSSVDPTASTTLTITPALSGFLGDYTFTVAGQYGGLFNYGSADLHVYDFTVAVSPSSATVLRGLATTYAVTLTLLPGSSTVNIPDEVMAVLGLPSGAAYLFLESGAPSFAGTEIILLITTAGPPTGALGNYPLSVTATDPDPSGGSRTGTCDLHIFDFTVVLTPISRTTLRGTSTVYDLTLELIPGSSTIGIPSMAISVTGLPAGATYILSAIHITPTLAGCSSSTPHDCQTLTVTTAAPPSGVLGNFTFSVTATDPVGGSRSASPSPQLHIFDFTVTLVPSTATLDQGGSVTMSVTLALVPGSTDIGLPSISTTMVGLPSDVITVGFPASMLIGETATFELESASVAAYTNCPQVVDGGGQILAGADLAHCDLAGYDLADDDLFDANLYDANLGYAYLAGATLQYANLAGANLVGTDFAGANLQAANLTAGGPVGPFAVQVIGSVDGGSRMSAPSILRVLGGDLSGDDFEGADLAQANLAWSVLTGYSDEFTDFNDAVLQQANLTMVTCGSPNNISADGANLEGMINVPAACNPPLGIALRASLTGAALVASPATGTLPLVLAAIAVILGAMSRLRTRRPPSSGNRRYVLSRTPAVQPEELVKRIRTVSRTPRLARSVRRPEEVLQRARMAQAVLRTRGNLESAWKLGEAVDRIAVLSRTAEDRRKP